MGRIGSELLPELTSFIEGLAEPRILVDLEYRILAANKAYRDAFGANESLVGRHCYEVSHHYARPCDEAGESCPRRSALASRHTERVLHIHHTPRGDEHVQVDLTPVRDASGQVRFFVERMDSLPTARAAASSQGLIGRATPFRQMLGLAALVAPTDTSVLLLGETGTGKELVARLIHEGSRRAAAPLVAVDCSGLTETLFESEIFGHEKGAFTGASSRKTGLVEAASGGTLFLDEIGDISLSQQVKLLRLIESSSYRRVGGVTPLRADCRLVAATHRNLKEMVQEGTFRSDLYYRISAFPIRMPALRERREDILLLAESLLGRVRPGQPFRLAEDAQRALLAHDYPGNVRELRNVIERASLLASDGIIRARHLPADVVSPDFPSAAGTAEGSTRRVGIAAPSLDRGSLERALAEHHGNRRAAAETLGISERTLYRRLGQHGLTRRGQ
jgi:two-component system response regulator HydG